MAEKAGKARGTAGSRTASSRAAGVARPVRSASAEKVASAPFMTVRHYCQGLGDCHLIRFRKSDGSDFVMLIDCGIHSSVKGGAAKMDEVVADIASVTDRIDILVITHEHVDHLSAFLSALDQFKKLTVGEVWMGWTESPSDAQARQLDKFKSQALAALSETGRRLDGSNHLNPHMANVRDGLNAILGFNFGVKGERVRAARDAAGALGQKGIRYLEPSSGVQTLEGVEGLRIYVLGPPRDAALLKVTDRDSEMYGLAGSASPLIAAMQGALGLAGEAAGLVDDFTAPFDFSIGMPLDEVLAGAGGDDEQQVGAFLREHYSGPAAAPEAEPKPAGRRRAPIDANLTDQTWRRIDMDWLAMSSTLAMQLDDRTNNTSLVLAFESVETGRVMLFAADAQIGSWLSWQDLRWGQGADTVTGPDLLTRTVYYKVGHHGSINATAKSKGLQLMTSADLAAFIPTNKVDAENVGWDEMPFHGILEDLEVRTSGRTVRADDSWLAGDALPEQFAAPSGSLKAVRHKKSLWVEFDVG
ncbi:MBL fold metallo-hydrolase [Inquilinus sp. YAF38]|uniref:MBL fold metallo-hydrolase n=1 Tax=Inquilinus sp. YAF38 TaxID=3233084 RepID=UPI003F91CE1F